MNLVELAADPEEQEQSPCKHGNIVTGHACYCHNNSEGMPRKCPIWREYGVGDLSKWKHSPWLPASRHVVQDWGEGDPRNIYVTKSTWPDEGCPGFETNRNKS